ncbi:carotenoid biosynthesis protein [Mucilaginibacter corticis]|nr:carotenoid biosynthesis protein [Mucilaginibacter corticis]
MERPKNIIRRRNIIAVRLIILFHAVGLVGLYLLVSKPLFLLLVPFHLLLMTVVLFFSHNQFGSKIIYFFVLLFFAGFALEWIGVNTSQLFGSYTYGPTLGVSFSGIPLIMGINWFLLIYSAGVSLQHSRIKSMWIRIILGALVLVMLDYFIEPVAIRLNYWHWAGNYVPVQNYGCWFITSVALLFVFEKFNFKKQGIAGPTLLVCQFIFFAALQ